MAEFKTPFIKKKGDTLFYSGEGEFVFIVPEMYFEPSRKCAIIEGEYVNLFGTIDYTILKNNETDVTKRSHKFFYPTMFYTKPGRMEKVKGLKLNNDDPEDYRLLFYKDNDIDVKDLKIDNSLGYNISFKTSIPSLLGKLINKSSYDIDINITGVKENGKIKYQRG